MIGQRGHYTISVPLAYSNNFLLTKPILLSEQSFRTQKAHLHTHSLRPFIPQFPFNHTVLPSYFISLSGD